jgi:hypothetical protein
MGLLRRSLGWALVHLTAVFVRRNLLTQMETPGMHMHREKATQGHNEEVSTCKPGTEISGEPTLIIPQP